MLSVLNRHQESLAKGEQEILGHLCVSTVTSGAKVDRDTLAQWFHEIVLPHRLLPNKIHPADAMARAMNEVEAKRLPSGVNGQFLNILSRHVASDRYTSTRQLVVEVVDAANKRLKYDPAAEVTLNRKVDSSNPNGDQVSTRALQVSSPAAAQAVADSLTRFRHLYDQAKVYFPAQTLRSVVRSLLLECGPVQVKGGVYFVLDQHRNWLQQVEALVDRMAQSGGEGTYLHSIAVPDTPKERRMVQDILREQTADDLARLTSDIEQALSTTGPLKASVAQDFLNRIRDLATTAGPFEQRLSITLDKVREGLAKAYVQVEQLIDRAEV